MKNIKVVYLREDSGNCRQLFKGLEDKKIYSRTESGLWYTVTDNYYLENDCPIDAKFIICDSEGNIISDNNNYSSLDEFIKDNTKDITKQYQDYYSWKKYILADKEKYNYTDYDENWLWGNSKEIRNKVEYTLNYLGQEIQIMRRCYEHKISGKRWTEFTAEKNKINEKILGYYLG